jgi:leader peptidase (prepilin peptidase) / N-methyltransferase
LSEIALAEIILAFFAGLLIGSFLNVCVYRLPRDLSVATRRSFCPECEKTIAWYDNIPLASYFMLRARCRNCEARIPVRYPVVELATALSFAICVYEFGVSLAALKYAVFAAILITLTASDFEERILPDEFTLGGLAVGLILAAFVPMEVIWAHLVLPMSASPRWLSVMEAAIGAGISSGLIWFVGWLFERIRHREGLGLGDVKMIAMIGAFLGMQWALLTLVMASLLGSVGGLAFVFLARKQVATYELPFGSFLGLAALGLAPFAWRYLLHVS